MGGNEEKYIKLGRRRWCRGRGVGFLLNRTPRFNVRPRVLQAKLFTFFGILNRCIQSLMRSLTTSSTNGGRTRGLVVDNYMDGRGLGHADSYGLRTCNGTKIAYMRSNSFYAEAIADCLEFIKRNSVPVESYANAAVMETHASTTKYGQCMDEQTICGRRYYLMSH